MENKYSLPEQNGISLPCEEIMSFGLDHNIIDSPGLLMHTFLCRTITSYLAKKLPKGTDINIDHALNNGTVYHFSRQEADYGKEGISKDSKTNEFMKDHSDMEYGLYKAKEYGFNADVTDAIESYILNPNDRIAYFPHETLKVKGNINWTTTIPMLTSWLIAGPITNTHQRFNDLRERRSGEIGKLELEHIKNNLLLGNSIGIPDPILEEAKKDDKFEIQNESDLLFLVKNGNISNEIVGTWILNGFENWVNIVIQEYCELCNIDDFQSSLQEGLDKLDDKQQKEKIKNEFEIFLGRELRDSEYIPYIPGIELIFNRLAMLKIDKNKDMYKKRVSRILKNLGRVMKKLS